MGYEQIPGSADGWAYDGLRIQADVETHRETMRFARQQVRLGARALDVGAGTGALAKQLLDAGYDVSCTSWDERVAVDIPSYRIDLDNPFTTAEVGGQPFDLVTCVEVIEHVENPSALLRSLRELVTPDGYVILSTPNVESAQARLQWLLRGCPLIFHGQEVVMNRHISMMWRQGLEFLIERAGLQIEQKRILGEARLASAAQALLKRPLYRLMTSVLSGELDGESRYYVLRRAARAAKKSGPGDVY